MPSELTIAAYSRVGYTTLGSRDAVCGHLNERLPGAMLAPWPTEFYEHMKARMGDLGVPFIPRLEACFQGDGFQIEFSCADTEKIIELSANVRGDGDPLPALRRLCEGTDWIVFEDATGRSVLDGTDGARRWQAFRSWRRELQRTKLDL